MKVDDKAWSGIKRGKMNIIGMANCQFIDEVGLKLALNDIKWNN